MKNLCLESTCFPETFTPPYKESGQLEQSIILINRTAPFENDQDDFAKSADDYVLKFCDTNASEMLATGSGTLTISLEVDG